MKNTTFAELPMEVKAERFSRIIRSKAYDTLTKEQMNEIIERVDVSKQYSIIVVSNPVDFEHYIMLKNQTVEKGDHVQSTVTEGDAVFGNFVFGKSDIKADEMGNRGRVKKSWLKDTSRPAAALLTVQNNGYDNLNVLMNENKIILYVPYQMTRLAG